MNLSVVTKITGIAAILTLTLTISACIGGDDDPLDSDCSANSISTTCVDFDIGVCNPADTPTVVHGFAIVGVGTNPVRALEVIDNSGDFFLSWDLTSSCSYTYSVYLSVNNELDQNDIEFFSGTCGVGYSCSYSVDIICSFDDTNKSIACSGDTAEDVSAALPGTSPQSLTRYIFFTASNEMSDQSDPVFQQVQVEF
jgi:hypothetical protein